MENNQVALSQAEVDKLLGIDSENSSTAVKAKKNYKVNKFLSEEELSEIQEICKSAYKHFKLDLRNKFGEPKIRKLTITALDQSNIDEFFDTLSDNDFIYELEFAKAKAYVKLDSFLFGALSGLAIDTKHKINFFQSQVLKDFVVSYLAQAFNRQLKEETQVKITSLYDQDKKPYATGKTGLLLTINWNENLRSFGIEKIFLTKEVVESFRALK
ncbi:MAG: hypothetical protein K5873_08275 [Treponema sp.]|nr:hypothetical protein [Treponema sp.]